MPHTSFLLSLGLCEPVWRLTLSFYWPQESRQIDLFFLCSTGVRRKEIKIHFRNALGLHPCQFYPFSPYRRGGIFFI
uniref:Uncharacterized protein n=1 Tax=Siphoviridae sp. ctnPP24 TaxID=2825662 RepID=A0A8S5TYT0_9CAUD|nr:MAG TPA: hypothetical protein [Siphoviridae sp. ctnPP24]